jgi:hypothetical protein
LERKGEQRFPTDKEVEEALEKRDVYNISPKSRPLYLLERLEHHNNMEPVLIQGNSNITIEHIFPQNPDPGWEDGLSNDEYINIKEEHLHTIGNLTLSGNNGKLGNKLFLEKRNMNVDGGRQGYRFSSLKWLNDDLKDEERWNKEKIETRTKRLTKRFLMVWTRPDINIDTSEENEEVNIFDADDPTGKKLEYAIFFDQKIDVHNVTDLYVEVVKQIFELHPEAFINKPLGEKIKLVSNSLVDDRQYRQYKKLDDTYSFDTHSSSQEKFKRIRELLTEFEYEDELFIKYKHA